MVVCFFSSIELRKAQDTHDARAAETKRRAAAVLKESQEKIAKVTALWCDVLQVCRADPPTLAAASFEGAQAASSWAAGCHKDTGTRAGVWYGVGGGGTGGLLLERGI